MKFEVVLGNSERKIIREATKQVLYHDKDWFLHDLFYIELLIEKKVEENKETEKKRKARKVDLGNIWR